jgi:hypothetical protein
MIEEQQKLETLYWDVYTPTVVDNGAETEKRKMAWSVTASHEFPFVIGFAFGLRCGFYCMVVGLGNPAVCHTLITSNRILISFLDETFSLWQIIGEFSALFFLA